MFKIFGKLKWFIVYYKKYYIYTVIAVIISNLLVVIPPRILGLILDGISSKTLKLNKLYSSVIILLLVVIANYIINYIWSYYIFKASDEIQRITRINLMKKYLRQSPKFFEINSTGSLMGKATNDVSMLSDFAGYGMMTFLDSTIYPIAIIFVMGFTIDWKLTLVSIIPLPLLFYFTKKIESILYVKYDKVQKSFDNLNDKVLENISGVRVVRSYTLEEIEEKEFEKECLDYYEKNMDLVKTSSLYSFISRVIPGLSMIVAISFGAYLVSKNQLTIGDVVTSTLYINMLVWPMFALGDFANIGEQATASMDRIQKVLDYEEDIVENNDICIYEGNGDIEFINFDFYYPFSNIKSLDNINLKLENGKTLGIVGKTGSGKTTLVKQILKMYNTNEKTLKIGENYIENISSKSLRKNIGYVPQNNIIFSKTIKENIKFGNSKSHESIEEVVNISDFKKDLLYLPEKLNTLAGERGVSLSGGQKQRISIARALYINPEILILDDSLSAVDANTEEKILENLKKTRKDKTNIITSHRLSAVKYADFIIVLDNGKIVQEGSHEKLFNEKGWYREQFIHQQLKGDNNEE